MKNLINLSVLVLALTVFATASMAQSTDQSGNQNKFQNKGQVGTQSQWVDVNGDGICDNFGTENQGSKSSAKGSKMNKRNGGLLGLGSGNGNGFGDGSGIQPQDGSGFGKGNGSGTCDGTGSKGSSGKGGRSK